MKNILIMLIARNFILYLIFFVIIASIAGCMPHGDPVHFQLPDNYRGVFKLVLDPTNGLVVSLKEGQFTYVIPTNGVLRVKTFDPFDPFHTESASYAGGTPIPMGPLLNPNISPDVVACRDTGMHEDTGENGQWVRSIAYVIGTENQELEAKEKRSWRLLK